MFKSLSQLIAGLMQNKVKNLSRFQPAVEALEDRCLPAAGSTVTAFLLGHLNINATNNDDTIIINHTNGRFSIEGVQIRLQDGRFVDSVSDLDVGRIYIDTYRGNDEVRFEEGDGSGNSTDNDVFLTLGDGNDKAFGGAAWSQITGGQGNDEIHGGGERDWLYGDEGDDIIYGDDGDDFIFGGAGRNILHGGEGVDDISAGDNGDILYGDGGDDVLREGKKADILNGGPGDDDIYIGRGGDYADGGEGDDWFGWGGDDPDTVYGGPGDDSIFGGGGDDFLDGGPGDDIIYGEYGNDTIYGGPGVDFINAAPGADKVFKDGTAPRKTPHGLIMTVSKGVLKIMGTSGNDVIEVMQSGGALTVDGASVPLIGLKKIIVDAGAGNDRVSLDSVSMGGEAIPLPSKLMGGVCDDNLIGGRGNDTMDGGAGLDTFDPGLGGSDLFKDDFDPFQTSIGGATFDDILQYDSETCAFLAALSATAYHQSHHGLDLDSRIVYLGDNRYRVRLFFLGKEITETVTFDGTWTQADAQPAAPGESWVILYQRAYLKAMQKRNVNPENLVASIETITGQPSSSFSPQLAEGMILSDETLAEIQLAISQNREVLAGTWSEVFRSDPLLVPDHGYAVLGFADNGDLILRNPWGHDNIDENGNFLTNDGNDNGIVTVSWEVFRRMMKTVVITAR